MSITVQIDELMLVSFAPGDRSRIAAGLAGELERLIRMGGLPHGLLSEDGTAALDGGSFAFPPGLRPEQVGARIARSIYGVPGFRIGTLPQDTEMA